MLEVRITADELILNDTMINFTFYNISTFNIKEHKNSVISLNYWRKCLFDSNGNIIGYVNSDRKVLYTDR